MDASFIFYWIGASALTDSLHERKRRVLLCKTVGADQRGQGYRTILNAPYTGYLPVKETAQALGIEMIIPYAWKADNGGAVAARMKAGSFNRAMRQLVETMMEAGLTDHTVVSTIHSGLSDKHPITTGRKSLPTFVGFDLLHGFLQKPAYDKFAETIAALLCNKLLYKNQSLLYCNIVVISVSDN